MVREEIISQLESVHKDFAEAMHQLKADEFEYTPEGKWSAGQQVEHLLLSTKALKPAFKIPKFVLKQRFGTANRPSRSYEALVERYQEKIDAGGTASSPFVPELVSIEKRESLLKAILETVAKLGKNLAKWSEEQMDQYILPHPLLGKITVREMMYFTIHHVQAHQKIIDRELNARGK